MANGVAWQEDEWNIYRGFSQDDLLSSFFRRADLLTPRAYGRKAGSALPVLPDTKSLARARVWKAKLAF
jgi:hypothetical protein